jgi:hypothetical protein
LITIFFGKQQYGRLFLTISWQRDRKENIIAGILPSILECFNMEKKKLLLFCRHLNSRCWSISNPLLIDFKVWRRFTARTRNPHKFPWFNVLKKCPTQCYIQVENVSVAQFMRKKTGEQNHEIVLNRMCCSASPKPRKRHYSGHPLYPQYKPAQNKHFVLSVTTNS